MTVRPKSPKGSLAGKLMLSGALILGSGTYAWWQHRPGAVMVALQPAAGPPAAMPLETPERPQAVTPSLEPETAQNAAAQASRAPMAMAQEQPAQTAPSATSTDDAPPAAVDNSPPSQQAAPAQMAPPVALASNAPPVPVPSPVPPPQPSGRYANGDFTGPSTDTPWGTVQVRVHVQVGAIAEVEPIDYPNHRRRSIQINEWALPTLEREVIQAQSAHVDIVSQATTTSVGYLRSLAGALAQAIR